MHASHHGHESVFLNLDSSEHSKEFDQNACLSTPLISLDQMPMSTMLSEDNPYFDSSQSFEMPCSATPSQTVTLRRSSRKKTNLPAMPVEDELSYDQPQQFNLSNDSLRPILTYLPRTPSRKTNISSSPGQFTSLTESPLLTTHLQINNMVTPMEAQKTTAKWIISPSPLIPQWLPIPQPLQNSGHPQGRFQPQPPQTAGYLQWRCHPRVPLKLISQQKKTM